MAVFLGRAVVYGFFLFGFLFGHVRPVARFKWRFMRDRCMIGALFVRSAAVDRHFCGHKNSRHGNLANPKWPKTLKTRELIRSTVLAAPKFFACLAEAAVGSRPLPVHHTGRRWGMLLDGPSSLPPDAT